MLGLGFGLAWACIGLRHVVTTAVNLYMQPSCCVQGTQFLIVTCMQPLDLRFFLPPPWWSLSLERRGYDIDVLFRAEHFPVSFSAPSPAVWASVFINHYLLPKEASLRLREILACEYNSKSLGVSLILPPFNKVIIGSPRACDLSVLHFWPQ